MSKRICFECVHRVLDPKQSPCVSDERDCWQCYEWWWQDESICLQCDGRHICRGWTARCEDYEKLEQMDAQEEIQTNLL